MIMKINYLNVSINDVPDNENCFYPIGLDNTYFDTTANQTRRNSMTFVCALDEFQHNLASRFSATMWLPAIDFSKLVIVGGCVLNALCCVPFPDTKEQDINLIYTLGDRLDFEETVAVTILKLKEIHRKYLLNEIQVEKIPGTFHYDINLPCGVKLNLLFQSATNSKFPLSHSLHQLDFDICQVAYNGLILFRN
jgi:hypothetical protein